RAAVHLRLVPGDGGRVGGQLVPRNRGRRLPGHAAASSSSSSGSSAWNGSRHSPHRIAPPSSNFGVTCIRRGGSHSHATARRLPARPFPPRGPSFFPSSDRKSTRLNSSHVKTSYAVFCLK